MASRCLVFFSIALLLVACVPVPPVVPPTATPAPSPTPLPTATSTPPPTATPTPSPAALSAAEILARQQTAMAGVKSMRFTMDMDVESGGQSVAMTAEGVMEAPYRTYMTVHVLDQDVESLVLGPAETYARLPGSDLWVEQPSGTGTADLTSPTAQLAMEEFATSVKLEGEEEIAGVDSYVISFGVDMNKLMGSNPALASTDLAGSTGSATVWVSKEDFRTPKVAVDMKLVTPDTTVTMTLEMEMSGFDVPVQIPEPLPRVRQKVLATSDPVFDVAFSPDGDILAACDDDQFIFLWSTADLDERLARIEHPDLVNAKEFTIQTADFYGLAFSPDGKTLAAASQDAFYLYTVADPAVPPKAVEFAATGHATYNDLNEIAFSPDGKTLAAGGTDGILRVWSVADLDAAPQELAGNTERIHSVLFTPDGNLLVSSGGDGKIRLWSTADFSAPLRIVEVEGESFLSLAVAPDGKSLFAAGPNTPIHRWSLEDLDAAPVAFPSQVVSNELAVSPDSKILASGDADGAVRLWSLTDPAAAPRVLPGHQAEVVALAFSPDGKTLASGAGDVTVRVWSLPDEQ
jgi:WD40 repeat protein